METKILFLDLDGTLLNDAKELTDGNRAAIDAAIGRGHHVVIASGRPLKSVQAQAARFGLDGPGCYAIAYNGAVLYDFTAQKQIFRQTIAPEDLRVVFDEARRRGIYIHTYDKEDVVIERRCDPETARRYCARLRFDFRFIDNLSELSESPVKAMSIDFTGQERTDAFRRWIRSEMRGRLDSYFSERYFLEIVPAGVNKGEGILKLCEILGIPAERSVAAGDEANDLDMLRAAGVGVAMANAIPDAKAVADYVTERDNNHDGVAEIIEKFLL